MSRTKLAVLAIVAALAVPGTATPAFATGSNNSEAPGSVLIFHKFVRGTVDVGLTGLIAPRTEIEISVTCPKGAACATKGEKVHMQAHWVCPPGSFDMVPEIDSVSNGEFLQPVCEEVDFPLQTTVNGTIYLNPEG